jgi:hypothetical protein
LYSHLDQISSPDEVLIPIHRKPQSSPSQEHSKAEKRTGRFMLFSNVNKTDENAHWCGENMQIQIFPSHPVALF